MRVPAVCAYPLVGLPTRVEVAKHNKGPFPPTGWTHDSRRLLVRLVPPIPGLWLCYTHSNCACNEIISSTDRVLKAVPLATEEACISLLRVARRIASRLPKQSPWTYDQVIAHFDCDRRARYESAKEVILRRGLSRSQDANISAFIKAEKANPAAKRNPTPRMIQARSAEYGLVVATFLKPIEKLLYRLKGPMGSRCVAKGLNQARRAELLISKMALFNRPVVFSLDASRWDLHCGVDVLKVEHAFYLMLNNDPMFQAMLSWQLYNKCRAMNGTKYTVVGGRMSGDMNTADRKSVV